MEVQNHIVLFLDILGYSNIISNCKDKQMENYYLDKIHGIMSNLSRFIEKRHIYIDQQNDNLHLSRFRSLLFSDNILFFAPYKNEIDKDNLYMNLLYGLSEFLVRYTKEDIFFRGGITAGNLYYDENLHFVFGSGLVKAYTLESSVAKYPRIVIDNELKSSPIFWGISQENEIYYLDYLSLGHSLIRDSDMPEHTKIEHFSSCLKEQKNAISKAYQKYLTDERVFPKYQWLAKYHNDYCKKNGFNQFIIEVD